MLDCAVEHMGAERANRYLRKFYPWYIERLGGTPREQAALQAALQQAESIERGSGAVRRALRWVSDSRPRRGVSRRNDPRKNTRQAK